MCDNCRKLIECPDGEKRRSLIRGSNTYTGTEINVEAVLDRDPKEGLKTFIHIETLELRNGEIYFDNIAFGINYCPFCGENLRGE